jgi:hypothetical protein
MRLIRLVPIVASPRSPDDFPFLTTAPLHYSSESTSTTHEICILTHSDSTMMFERKGRYDTCTCLCMELPFSKKKILRYQFGLDDMENGHPAP